jgi:hypothetical protein
VFRVLVPPGPVLAFTLTRMICHMVEARRRDEAKHGIETGRIAMNPRGRLRRDPRTGRLPLTEL